jgi:hypothetical protein
MKARNIALLAILAAGGLRGAVHAQPLYPTDEDNGTVPYEANQDYDNQDPYYDDQSPYYDEQGPDGSYDNPDPNYDSGYDQGYYDQGSYDSQGQVDVSIFYSNLHPYGRWIQRASYGWVWEPTRVQVGWRPYTVGRWVNTEYGWTWVSDEPWGWATYHYGRWLADPEYGWLWVPGREWGPAWCSFQQGDGYIGWAPLPPSVGFQAGFGIQIGGLRLSAAIGPTAYSFVPERAFLESRVDRVIVPRARNLAFFRHTRDITNIRVVENRVVNRSVPVERIEQVTGRRVQRFRVAEVRNPNQAPRGGQFQGDRVRIFRPAPTLAPARPDVTPQAVINRRAQIERRQPGQPPVSGQPDGRFRRQPPPGQPVPDRQPRWQQPQDRRPVEAQPGQPQAQPQQQPRWRQQPAPPEPAPQGQPPRWQRQQRPAPSAEDLDRRRQAEQQRQQAEERNRRQPVQEQQRERPQQDVRQRRERPAPETRPAPPQDRRNQGQGEGQQDQGNRNRRERRQQPPPPPPPGR